MAPQSNLMVRERVVDDILARRMKQLEKHPETGDDAYTNGTMGTAGGLLAAHACSKHPMVMQLAFDYWPWKDWKLPVHKDPNDRLLDAAFAYQSPGYRDWSNYADEPRFKLAWLNYLSPRSSRRLEANGVGNLQDLMFGLLGQVAGGCVDYLV